MSQLSPIIQNLLASVKKHSQLNDDINSSSEAFLERRQLRTQILDSFKSWIENNNNNNNNNDDNDEEKNRKEGEIIVVADACRQIVQLRLTLGVHDGGDDNNNDDNASRKIPQINHQEESSTEQYFSNDSTLNLVLDCADIFVLARKNNNFASPSALEPWKNFIVFLCTNSSSPLEVSLRGFQLLVKWILGTQQSQRKNDEGENQAFLAKCLGSNNSNANNNNNKSSSSSMPLTPGVLMSRMSSVLQEKFSVEQTKKFCLSTGFHQILQKDGLISVHFSDAHGKNNNNSNTTKTKREKRDALTIATIFSSIGYVVKCCGPQALEEQVAIILASYLIRSKDVEADEDSDSLFERKILKPFVHQTISEMFQRGVNYHHQEIGGENNNNNNNQNAEIKQQEQEGETENERTFSWSNFCHDEITRSAAASGENSSSDVIIITPIKSVSILASALLKSILLPENSSDNESIELWTRSVAAMSSSYIGLQTLVLAEKEQEEEEEAKRILARENDNNNNSSTSSATPKLSFQAKMSVIVKQMLRSSASSGSTAVKIIALNTVQSSAVPLAEDMKAALSLLNHQLSSSSSSSSSSMNYVLLLLQQIIRQSSSFLQQLLFSVSSNNNNSNDTSSSFFASVLLPLGTRQATLFSSSNTNEEDSVGDAFWTMIEQLIAAPPFVELTRLLGNSNNVYSPPLITQVAQDFVAFFVEPVLSPMMPSLVSLMSSTSQKELGRNLYQRRRVLANSLMRIEQFVSSVAMSKSVSSSAATTPLICGCSKIMWNKLKNSILVAGGSLE